MTNKHTLEGQIVSLHERRIFPGRVQVAGGRVVAVEEDPSVSEKTYLLPGFVDAHVHIESSMLVPSAFAALALPHGTLATVSDPHEIANVLGVSGVEFMLENAALSPLKFHFGAPSCVPATTFETAGAALGPEAVRQLLERDDIWYLAEMMNWPGVLHEDAEVMAKIRIAHELGKPVDGHAPGLRGDDARRYAAAGITTDHECTTIEEARDKLAAGMHILIREGSAAKNFEALIPLLAEAPERIMFCSDDKHPDDLIRGHINELVVRALRHGHDLFDVLRAACLNPVQHYGLPVGTLRPGEPADLIRVRDLETFEVLETWIDGQCVARDGQPLIELPEVQPVNNFSASAKQPADFAVPAMGRRLRVIRAIDGSLLTETVFAEAKVESGKAVADTERDLLKIAVVNRYADVAPAVAFVQGFGLKRGAIASSVAHDSHNIIAVGADDEALCRAVNLIIRHKGGIAAVAGSEEMALPLPVAGLMTA
ncbi:MAG: adenine deaminase, partial [Bacteroidetes bacterium]